MHREDLPGAGTTSCHPDSELTVVHVFPMLELGGSQLGTLRQAAAQRADGVRSQFLAGCATPEGLASYRDQGFTVECFAETWEWGMQGPWRPDMAEWLAPRLADCDVVHAHHGAAWWQTHQVIAPDMPLIVTEHSVPPYSRVILAQLAACADRADRFLTVGPGVRALARKLGVDPGKMESSYSPIEGMDGTPKPGLAFPRLVFAGRLVDTKGVDTLLDALALMQDPPVAYLLGSGPNQQELEAQAEELGISNRVQFCGWQNHPEQWISGASVVAVPSRREAWGQTAVLAMAHRVPVVGCAGEGLPETLGFGSRGLLAPVGDPDGLSRALSGVLGGSLGIDLDAAERYASQFSPDMLARRFTRIYQDLIAERTSAGSCLKVP